MGGFSFELDKSSKKFECVSCGKRRAVRYINITTGEYLPIKYMRCDRESKCGYHLNPYSDRYGKADDLGGHHPRPSAPIPTKPKQPPKPIGLINPQMVSKFAGGQNEFIQYLHNLFDELIKKGTIKIEQIDEAIKKYRLGTYIKNNIRYVIFWQITPTDKNGNSEVRTGKAMQYNSITGKRVKAKFATDWMHRILTGKNAQQFNLKQCFFGAHLISEHPNKIICVAESEKTAIIASILMPQYVWVATGALQGLTDLDKSKVFKGREVILFPDLSELDKNSDKGKTYHLWSKRATEIMQAVDCRILTNTVLEEKATPQQRAQGLDIADFIIQQLTETPTPTPPPETIETTPQPQPLEPTPEPTDNRAEWIRRRVNVANWDDKIKELTDFFDEVPIPDHPIKVSDYSTILNADKYIKTQLMIVTANNGNITFLPYLHRLEKLKNIITNN